MSASYRPDHYTALGIRPDADGETIRAAYRNLAKQVHPDASVAEAEEATERFVRLQEAYDVLRDPLRRAQYDAGRAREAERARAARQPIPRRPPAKPPTGPATATAANIQPPGKPLPRPLGARIRAYWPYLAGVAVLVMVTIGITIYQQYTRAARERQIMIVRVDPQARAPYRERTAVTDIPTGTPHQPGETGILSKEIDRLLQRQVDRVEEAKKKMEAQKTEMAQQQAKAAPPQTAGPVPKVPKVECTGAGRTFVMTTDKDGTRFSTDDATPVTPRISDLGTGVVLVSRIESTNRLAIGFKKGLRDSTTVLMFDSGGSVQHSFNVECSAAAF